MEARPAILGLAPLAGTGSTGFTATPVRPAKSAPPSTASSATPDPDLAAQIDELAQAALTDGVTGAVVGISDPVGGSYLQAYGTADTAGTPMTTDVHYRIASVTKTFTAQAVLRTPTASWHRRRPLRTSRGTSRSAVLRSRSPPVR